MIHGIQSILDVHPDWVVLQMDAKNAFNTISCKAIFLKHQVASG
jgi:hypothetical protein